MSKYIFGNKFQEITESSIVLAVADQSEGDEEDKGVTHCTLIFEGQTDELSSCDTYRTSVLPTVNVLNVHKSIVCSQTLMWVQPYSRYKHGRCSGEPLPSGFKHVKKVRKDHQ